MPKQRLSGNTRWRPDTCGCVVTYDWTQRGEQTALTNPVFEVVCRLHMTARDDADRFVKVQEHNRANNNKEED